MQASSCDFPTPGLRPAGWLSARQQVDSSATHQPLTMREADLVTRLMLRDGRWVPTDVLARELFADEAATGPVRKLVWLARKKLGRSLIESAPWAGYRIPGRYRDEVPTVCARCGSPVEFEGREWACTDCGRNGEIPKMPGLDRGVTRRGYADGTRQGSAWTEQEKAFVLAHLDDMSLTELGVAVDRTPDGVRGFLATNNIKKPYVHSRRTATPPLDAPRRNSPRGRD